MIDIRLDKFVDANSAGKSEANDALVLAHHHCAAHRQDVLNSTACGCFSCCSIFPPTDISEWMEETSGALGQRKDSWTAICPRCGIDAVIGTASGFPVDQTDFLQALNRKWFQ